MILCDEVFEILTRGPFPTGAPSDGIVESHLTHCDACRQLAEALRPAVELFQEAVTPEESRTLPSYWGESSSNLVPWLSTEKRGASQLAQRKVRAAARGDRRRRLWPAIPSLPIRSVSLRPAARLAAALLLGMALAGLLRQLGSPAGEFRGFVPASNTAGNARWLLSERGGPWSERHGLSQLCIADASAPTLMAARLADRSAPGAIELACCSSCHTAQGSVRQASARATATAANACGACHPPIE